MSAGILALTNKSDVVAGTGTLFNTELVAGDFIVVVAGGITYTLAVKSVDSATKLTLVSKYPGPTQTGLAWNSVPRATQNQVTAELVVQSTEALRGLNYDKQNWQQIFSNSGNITVRLPDGSTFSGPSWNKISSIIATVDIDLLQILATQIDQDAAQVGADKTAAALSASTASTDAGIATKKAGEASASANTATSKAGEASDSAELARKWAANPEDVVVSGGEYSSYHWSQKAEKSAAEAASHNPNEALVKTLNLSDLMDRAAAWLNVRPEGATPLAADPVSAYDATTRRWVENLIGAGTIGPTMNGVMNYGVGGFRLHDSRAYIAPYEIASDGQILDRALWPELWAHAQMHGAIDDSVWVADPSKRGLYSKGDGTTTFRVPDRNGAQKNGVNGFTGPSSIIALFGRGDSGAAGAGDVRLSAAPDVTGQFQTAIPAGASGAFKQGALNATKLTTGGTIDTGIVTFKLSDGNSVYGRSSGEISPNAFLAVWVIRASGGFTAANTSWSVINGDAVVPSSGTVVRGGEVISNFRVGSADYVSAVFRAKVTINGEATPEVVLRDNRSGTNVETIFPVRNGISADVGYTLLSVSNPALGSRTVLTNPFGNNTPVMCEVEVFHAALGKWMTTPWTWVQTNNNTYGCNAWFAEGEGIILKIGNTGYVSATSFTGASQEISTPLIVPSSVRIRVWKLVP
ncbi:hypothetical protein [Lelliottia amnigena]|jgi:hypothetical protein